MTTTLTPEELVPAEEVSFTPPPWTTILRANLLTGGLRDIRLHKVSQTSSELTTWKVSAYHEHWSLWRGTTFLGLLCRGTHRWLWMAADRGSGAGYVTGPRQDILDLIDKELTTETRALRGNTTPQP